MPVRQPSTLRRALQACALSLAAAAAVMVTTGCASMRGDAVPARATVRAEGNGDLVSYTTDTGGTGYVYDATDDKLVWSGTLLANQMITVDAKHDAVEVDGRKVREKGIHNGHHYRIFVEPVIHS